MEENIRQERTLEVLREEYANDNHLLQYYEGNDGKKKVRFLYMTRYGIRDMVIAGSFEKYKETIDPERNTMLWYDQNGKAIEFNPNGIALMEYGRLYEVYDISGEDYIRIGSDCLTTAYRRLFTKASLSQKTFYRTDKKKRTPSINKG